MSNNAAPYILGDAASPPVGNGWPARFERWLHYALHSSGLPLSSTGTVVCWLGLATLTGGGVFVATENELASALAAAACASLSAICFCGLITFRHRQFESQLPRWVEMLARALRAGQSLEQALRTSQQKLAGPFAQEVRRAADRLDLGLTVEEAFREFMFRFRSLELTLVRSALVLHRQSGGEVTMALERLAAVAQQRLEYRRQTQAANSTARFAAICLAIAPPAIFAYYWYTNQFVDTLLHDPSGQFALGLAVVLELVGLAWLLYLSRAEA